jgi:hypothetical protein
MWILLAVVHTLLLFISIITSIFLEAFFFNEIGHDTRGFLIFIAAYLTLRSAFYFAKRQHRIGFAREFPQVIDEIRGRPTVASLKAEMREMITKAKNQLQVREDQLAQSLVYKISSNNQHDPYSVFLRAFTADGRWTLKIDAEMKLENEKQNKHILHFGFVRDRMTIDDFLAQITYEIAPLVALSLRQRKSLARPAFTRVSDEEWQGAVLTLIDHSSCIFFLRGMQNGIVWGIQRIVERADWRPLWRRVIRSTGYGSRTLRNRNSPAGSLD